MNKINDALLNDFDNNLEEIKKLVPEYLHHAIDRYAVFKKEELEFNKNLKAKEKELSKKGLSKEEIDDRLSDLLDEQDEDREYNDGYAAAIISEIDEPRDLSKITNEKLQEEYKQIVEKPIYGCDNCSFGYNSAREDIIFSLDAFLNGPKEKIEKIDKSLKERVPKWMHFAIDKYLGMEKFLEKKDNLNNSYYTREYGNAILSILNNTDKYGITDKNNSIENIENMTSTQLKNKMHDLYYVKYDGMADALNDMYLSKFDILNNIIRTYDDSIFEVDEFRFPTYKDLYIENLNLSEVIKKEENEIKAFKKCMSKMTNKKDLFGLIFAIDKLPKEERDNLLKDDFVNQLYHYMDYSPFMLDNKIVESLESK